MAQNKDEINQLQVEQCDKIWAIKIHVICDNLSRTNMISVYKHFQFSKNVYSENIQWWRQSTNFGWTQAIIVFGTHAFTETITNWIPLASILCEFIHPACVLVVKQWVNNQKRRTTWTHKEKKIDSLTSGGRSRSRNGWPYQSFLWTKG